MTVIKKHDGTDWQEVVVGESGQWNSAQTIRAETASTALTTADAGSVIVMNSSSATAITVNGSTSFSPGQRVDFLRQGTGNVVIGGSGVTINATPGLKLRARYSGASLLCIRPNVYVLTGDLDEAFSPLSLSPALWLDAADVFTITSSGSPAKVSQWNDKASGYDVSQSTAANQPQLILAAQNGLSALSFSANSLANTTGIPLLRNAAGASVFAVVRNITPTAESRLFHVATPTAGLGRFVLEQPNGTSVRTRTRRLDADSLSAVSRSETTSSWGVQAGFANYSGGSITARWNGESTTTAVASYTGNTSDTNTALLRISGNSTGLAASNFNGEIGEIVLYDRILSNEEITNIENYLQYKWGVTF